MPPAPGSSATSLVRPWTLVALTVAGGVACTLLQMFAVRPFLSPAGHGATLAGEATAIEGAAARLPLTRPPVPGALSGHVTVVDVPAGSPADEAGLREGDVVLSARNEPDGRAVDLSSPPRDADATVRRWRDAYRLGTRGPLELNVRHAEGGVEVLRVARPPAWASPWHIWLHAVAVHAGPLIEMVAIVGAAVLLLLLRPRDATALLIVSTLALAGTSSGGMLLGGELAMPAFLGAPITVFSWLAMPLAFPLIAITICYFPRKSGLLVRHPGSTPCPSSWPSRWSFRPSARRCFWQAPTVWCGRPHGTRPTRTSSTRRLPAACC